MENLKLNKDFGKPVIAHGYELDATKEYVVDLKKEMKQQMQIAEAVKIMGLPALKDYFDWLLENNFHLHIPTNDFVSEFYGKKPLWKTELSQGIVVKAKYENDYYVILECSRLNRGFQYTQIIVTLGGCI